MSVKISFMHYMKCIKVMLLVVFEKFELVCTFLLFFSCHYHCQLVKGQLSLKYGGVSRPPPPILPVSTGLVCMYIYISCIYTDIFVYKYICIYVCIYTDVCMYTNIHKKIFRLYV